MGGLGGGLSDFATNAGLNSVGGVAGNLLTGGLYGNANVISGGQVGNYFSSRDPTNPSKSNADYAAAGQSINDQNAANQAVITGLGQSGAAYTGGLTDATNAYTGAITSNTNNAVTGLQNAGNKTNTQLSGLSNSAINNAQGAETLQQLENPNTNPWAQNVQTAYNQQAQGIQNQGLASYGVLAGLGSQATAQQLGGAGLPVTGGQLEALQGANLSQAGNEFANAQSQANQLRQAGLQAGINQANTAYGFGQQAHQQAISDVGAYAQNNMAFNNAILGAQNNAARDVYNANSGLAGAIYGTQVGQANAQLGQNDLYYGAQQSLATGEAGAAQASNAANLGAITSIVGGVAGGASQGAAGKGGALTNALALNDGGTTESQGAGTMTTQQQPYTVPPSPMGNVSQTTPRSYAAPYSGVSGGYSAYGASGGGYNPGSSLAQNPYAYNPYDQVS